MLDIDGIVTKIDPEKDYTSAEIAGMFGVTAAALNNSARRGSLPSRKIFNKYYFKGRNIRAYLLGEKIPTEIKKS